MIHLLNIAGGFLPKQKAGSNPCKPVSIWRAGYKHSAGVAVPFVEEWLVVGAGVEKVRGEEQRVYFLRIIERSSVPAGFDTVGDLAMLPNARTIGGDSDGCNGKRMELTGFFESKSYAFDLAVKAASDYEKNAFAEAVAQFEKDKLVFARAKERREIRDARKKLKFVESYRGTYGYGCTLQYVYSG